VSVIGNPTCNPCPGTGLYRLWGIAVSDVAKIEAKAKVFISYSRKDLALADKLGEALKARGYEPLIDRDEVYAFED
jgi:TIR domain